MTPKEKAIKLVDKFLLEVKGADRYNYNLESMNIFTSKQCAIIAVNEVIEQCDYVDTYIADLNGQLNPNLRYWQEVKQEIEKL